MELVMESRGLGDDIKKLTSATGLDRIADRIAEILGTDCGCDSRQDRLNKMFPKKPNQKPVK
jgi:hypothetical protein